MIHTMYIIYIQTGPEQQHFNNVSGIQSWTELTEQTYNDAGSYK